MMTSLRPDPGNLSTIPEPKARQEGFSLIEVMIAMVIVSMLLSAVYAIFASLTRSYTTQNVSAEVQQSIRAAIDIMAEDIMMAGLDPINSGQFGFETSGSNRISFRFDQADQVTNQFNGIRDAQELVTYEFSGGTLFQCFDTLNCNLADAQNRFIDNVIGFNLTYIDGIDQDLINDLGYADPFTGSSLNNIRKVIISITVQELAGLEQTVTRTYSTTVRCRNVGI